MQQKGVMGMLGNSGTSNNKTPNMLKKRNYKTRSRWNAIVATSPGVQKFGSYGSLKRYYLLRRL